MAMTQTICDLKILKYLLFNSLQKIFPTLFFGNQIEDRIPHFVAGIPFALKAVSSLSKECLIGKWSEIGLRYQQLSIC